MTVRTHKRMAIIACLVLAAAACGGEVDDSDDNVAADTATTTTTEAASDDDTASGADDGQDSGSGDDTADSSDNGSQDADDPDPADPGDEGTDGEASSEPSDDGPAPNIYDDPRDGIFDEFQAMMDRGDHPFMQLDAFCHAHEPAPDRMATDAGIEADSISLVHLRSKLEDFEAIGFGVPVGDVAEMFDVFTTVVNEQCGGIRGRMIEMHTIELEVLGATVDEDRNAACIEAIEDLKGVILLNSSGFQGSANLCIAEEHETAFISAQAQPEEFMRRGEDRLISNSPTAEESLSWLALDLINSGALEGKTVGVAAPDTPGQYDSVRIGLVEVLESHGVDVAVFDVIGCGGGTTCNQGVVESVQRLRDEGVDVFFNVLNVVSSPGYIVEMANQGFKPGDVQFYASDFNSHAGELVASKIVAFGGKAAGDLYNGALIVDDGDTGSYRLEGYEPRVFNEMCAETYAANSPTGQKHETKDRSSGSSAYGMLATVCDMMRIALRAIYDAGDNPTRFDIYETLASLGPVDSNEMLPFSIRPGKTQMPDAIHTLRFEYPCTKPSPFGAENICIYPIDDYRPAPR